MRLYLVRHAQTAWNREGRAQGHTDVLLDDTGRWQAEQLGARLATEPIERVVASDLTRCRETLAPLLALRPIATEYRADLRERTFGEMEGEDYRKLHDFLVAESARTGEPAEAVRPPGGESVLDVRLRLEPFMARLVEAREPTLVVSHGGTLAQILSTLIKGGWETARSFRFANASVTELSRRPNGAFVIERFNETAHLESALEAAGVT